MHNFINIQNDTSGYMYIILKPECIGSNMDHLCTSQVLIPH